MGKSKARKQQKAKSHQVKTYKKYEETKVYPYLYDEENNFYHMYNCSEVNGIKEKLKKVEDIPYEGNICPVCYRKVIINYGMDDNFLELPRYVDFFSKYYVPSNYIKKLTLQKGAKFRIISDKCLLVYLKTKDKFRIVYDEKKGHFILYHANYKVRDGRRRFVDVKGEHAHEYPFNYLKDALKNIGQYSHWNEEGKLSELYGYNDISKYILTHTPNLQIKKRCSTTKSDK